MFNHQSNRQSRMPMPLIMSFTNPTIIEMLDKEESPMMYDPVSQITPFHMRTVCTKCARGVLGSKTNPLKNVNDDTKTVK